MSAAQRITTAAIVALAALQLAWHAWLVPPVEAAPWALAIFFTLPILPALVLALMRHRRAGYWGALAALLYFSHGVMVAWSSPGELWLGMIEAALSTVLVVAASWDGMQARFNKPRGPTAL
ncbi:MAG: DUF2069 domain-containing protein [Arenimonas sp.]|uniref:DUF2069 domain-containing protein n=1 Tax=Arenimonas sp. TaxID=1872635 RepID=UPI0025BA18FB|nr:DUF2069 domain-containing protein [Arenimonas sp.]MBW8367203.1 DUF2069 domain-containing protein [Arenimonas sp.]